MFLYIHFFMKSVDGWYYQLERLHQDQLDQHQQLDPRQSTSIMPIRRREYEVNDNVKPRT